MASITTPHKPTPRQQRATIADRRAKAGPLLTPPPALHLELTRKVEGLPRDLGVVFIGLGVVGIAIPGPIPPGASFVVLGVLFLSPGLIARLGGRLAHRFPRPFRFLVGFVDGLHRALERRYPDCIAG